MNRSKEQILETAFNAARKYEMKSGGCPQCTLAGFTICLTPLICLPPWRLAC